MGGEPPVSSGPWAAVPVQQQTSVGQTPGTDGRPALAESVRRDQPWAGPVGHASMLAGSGGRGGHGRSKTMFGGDVARNIFPIIPLTKQIRSTRDAVYRRINALAIPDENPMTVDLTAAEFNDEAKAREWLETSRWPNGPYCPHCGSFDALRMEGQGPASRPFPLPRLPWAVHRPDRLRHGEQPPSADEVGSGDPADDGQQEGHVGASNPSHAQHRLQNGLVHVPSHPRGYDARRRRLR